MKTIVQLVTELKTYFLGKDTAAKQAVEANIAPVETDASAASQGYSVGAQLFLGDVLYDVTAPIAQDDALVVNTNIKAADNVSSDIVALTKEITDAYALISRNGAKNHVHVTATSQTINGVTFTVNDDGSIKANGTATEFTAFDIETTATGLKAVSGNYLLSDGLANPSASHYTTITVVDKNDVTTYDYANTKDAGKQAFSIVAEDIKSIYLAVCIGANVTVNDLVFYPMVRDAEDIDSDFQPYAKTNQQLTAENQTLTNNVDVLIKNGAVNYCNFNKSTETSKGYTFTNNNGVVHVTGSRTSGQTGNVDFNKTISLKAGTYKLTGCPSGGSNDTWRLILNINNSEQYVLDYGDGAEFTLSADSNNVIVYCSIMSAYSASVDMYFKPMIADANYSGDYVPYAKSNRELTEDNNDLNTKMSYINPINVTMNVYMTSDAVPSWGNFTTQDATDIAQAMYDVYKKIGGKQGNYFGGITLIWYKKSDGTSLGSENDLCEIIMSGANYNTCLADNSKTRMRFSLKPYGYCVTTDFALWGSSFNYLRQGTDTSGAVIDYHEKQTAGTISTYVG